MCEILHLNFKWLLKNS